MIQNLLYEYFEMIYLYSQNDIRVSEIQLLTLKMILIQN